MVIPADPVPPGRRCAVEYMLGCIAEGRPVQGPLDPALSLVGQRIIDTAVQAAAAKTTLKLVD